MGILRLRHALALVACTTLFLTGCPDPQGKDQETSVRNLPAQVPLVENAVLPGNNEVAIEVEKADVGLAQEKSVTVPVTAGRLKKVEVYPPEAKVTAKFEDGKVVIHAGKDAKDALVKLTGIKGSAVIKVVIKP